MQTNSTLTAVTLSLALGLAAAAQDSTDPVRTAIDPAAQTVAQTELFIAAAPDAVWRVLTDIGGWTAYMPEFAAARLDGPLAPGSVIHWEPMGQVVASHLVLVEPGRRLVWNGTEGAVHVWDLVPMNDGTLLRNAESIDDWSAAGPEGSAMLTDVLNLWNRRIAEQATQ